MRTNSCQYIIDGYNALHKISNMGWANFSNNRFSFIHFLEREFSNLNILLVFDGYPGPEEKISGYSIKIKFSRKQSADDLILKIAKKSNYKKNIVVVTDDRELKNSLKRYKISAKNVAVFFKKCYNENIPHKTTEIFNKPGVLSSKGKRITEYLYRKLIKE